MARKKNAASAGGYKAVRRNTETGELAPAKRGRPAPGWEAGFVDAAGNFVKTKPKGKRGRPKGSGSGSGASRGPGRPKGSGKGGPLSARLQQIIEREVAARLKNLHREIASNVRQQVIADLSR